MRVLIAYGTTRGGTAGIADIIAESLRAQGHEVEVRRATPRHDLDGFDAAIIGGALYANRWHKDARRFVARNVRALRVRPVWFFSSGPLDDSAGKAEIPPVRQVQTLMERVGARDHATFGGRLERDAKGFAAAKMAETLAGDWRDPDRIRAWAAQIAVQLPGARPGFAVEQPARAVPRLVLHGVIGWAACALVMAALLRLTSPGAAVAIHAVFAPAVFAVIAAHYFRPRGAREPLATAIAFTAIVALLDLVVVAGFVQRSLAMFASIAGTWVPFAAIFLVTWAIGAVRSMMPVQPPARA